MNRYEAGFAGVNASPEMKARLYARLNDERRLLAAEGYEPRVRIGKKRKALLIIIAAVILLMSACAVYAVYWSSTQRAKEYAQSEQATDDRLALAEQSADAIIAGTRYYAPIDQTAQVDGITFQFKGIAYWPNDNPPQVYLVFDATDAQTGDASRLYDFEYSVTIGGTEYPAYAKADGTTRALPAIARAEDMDAQYETWFRVKDEPIVDQTDMTISGTLYEYDPNGARGKAVGSFSFDATYRIPTEQIEADRERLIADILGRLDDEAADNNEALKQLPDDMTALDITQDEYTFTDVQATKDGFLLGQTRVTYGADAAVFYMDGYRLEVEPISDIFTPDQSRPRQDVAWEVAYYGTFESVTCYPWYAPVKELPETVLIAVLRDAGTKQRTRSDINGYYEGDMITYTWNAVELLLRVNPRTGEITLPKDDAEREAWRTETLRLAEDGRNYDYLAPLSGSQTNNGVTMSLVQLYIKPNSGSVSIECKVDGMYDPRELSYGLMHLAINGVEQDTTEAEFIKSQYTFSEERGNIWVESYGGWQVHNDWFAGQEFGLRVPRSTWQQDFTIHLQMEIYDRDENWNRVYIGSFDLTATAKQDDIISGPVEEIHELQWRRSVMAEDGN